MPYSIVVTKSIKEGSSGITFSSTIPVETITKIAELIAPSTVDERYSVGIDRTKLKALLIKCAVAMTVKTNSAETPDETFTIPAGSTVMFVEGESPIFSSDVTALYVSNAGTVAGLFEAMIAIDV